MRRLMGGLVCVLLVGGATVSGAQEPGSCRWTPDPATVEKEALSAVSAVEPTNVFAVGATVNSQDRVQTIVRHWDGLSWETQPRPTINSDHHELTDVVALPDGTAWAVGDRWNSGSAWRTLLLRYDGITWRTRRSLNPSEDRNFFHAVDVAPSGDVYVVGDRWNAKRQFRTTIQRYDGKGWKVFRTDPGILYDVDVISDDDIWAVGEKGVRAESRTFVVHFDGTRWTEVQTPSPGPGFSTLLGVSAAAPDDVWAVGQWGGYSGGDFVPWMIHYDGTSWSAVDLPDLTTQGRLTGVSALDADTAVAVGRDVTYPIEDMRILIEWDGTSWTRAEHDGGTHTAWLMDVDLAPNGEGWTVGTNQTGSPAEGTYVFTDYIERRTCG